MLLLHTGQDPDRLLLLANESTGTPSLRSLFKTLYIVLAEPVERKTHEINKNCKEPSSEVFLPLPENIARLVRRKMNWTGNFFEYTSSNGTKSQLRYHHIADFIDKFIKSNYGRKITIARIRSSFYTLYSNRFGLDPIYCCYVSGGLVQKLYESQLHYIYVDSHSLALNYLNAFKELDKKVRQLPHKASIREPYRQSLNINYINFFMSDSSECPSEIPVSGYGSPRVPILENMQKIVSNIKASTESSKNVIERHNLYVCYAHLCLEFSGGLRPRNALDQNPVDFSKDHNSIVLRDKESPIFSEERLILLPETAYKIISKLVNQYSKIRTLVASRVNSLFINSIHDQIFFFLDNKSNKIDFTMEKYHQVLKSKRHRL